MWRLRAAAARAERVCVRSRAVIPRFGFSRIVPFTSTTSRLLGKDSFATRRPVLAPIVSWLGLRDGEPASRKVAFEDGVGLLARSRGGLDDVHGRFCPFAAAATAAAGF